MGRQGGNEYRIRKGYGRRKEAEGGWGMDKTREGRMGGEGK